MILLLSFLIQWTLLQAFHASLVARWRNRGSAVEVEALAWLGIGLWGYLIFWVYYFSNYLGWAFSAMGVAYSIYGVIQSIRHKNLLALVFGESSKRMALLVALILCVILSIQGQEMPLPDLVQDLFRGSSADNQIPRNVSESWRMGTYLLGGNGGWTVSDRPILQSGLYLAFSVFADIQWYWSFGMILQLLCLAPLWILMQQRVPKLVSATPWSLMLLLTSPFLLINTINVWPKLLAAAYFLWSYLILERAAMQSSLRLWLLAGGLLGLGALSHTGVVLAAPILLVPILRGGIHWGKIRGLGWSILAFGFLQIPWRLFTKFVNPPGDGLLKMHLAGANHTSPRPLFELILEKYSSLSLGGWAQDRWTNFWTYFFPGQITKDFVWHQSDLWKGLSFFHLSIALGALVLSIVWIYRIWSDRNLLAEMFFWGISFLIWCLVMVEPYSTVIHQGSYVLPLMASLFAIQILDRAYASTIWIRTLGSLQLGLCIWLFA